MAKKILIVHGSDKRMETAIEKEFMWKLTLQKYQHLAVTRNIELPNKRLVEYEDGTVVEMLPALSATGKRLTHLYVAKSVVDLDASGKLMSHFSQTIPVELREENISVFEFVKDQGITVESWKK